MKGYSGRDEFRTLFSSANKNEFSFGRVYSEAIGSEPVKDRIQCGFKYGKMGKRFRRGDRDVKLSIVRIKVIGDGIIGKKIS